MSPQTFVLTEDIDIDRKMFLVILVGFYTPWSVGEISVPSCSIKVIDGV